MKVLYQVLTTRCKNPGNIIGMIDDAADQV